MKLVPKDGDPEGPGLWADPNWKPGMPGTFAVVIGVSRYRHLAGGAAPVDPQGNAWISETQELGQLHVSALTAFRFFDWLTTHYHYEGAPLARCWLLLSPTPAEPEFFKFERTGERVPTASLADPTLANCGTALRWWFATMRGLPAAVAAQSRGLFFFSGHGLEVSQENQLLLPSDYLAPPAPNYNDALSTSNVRYGVGALKVNQQLFFVDACRNDHKELRATNVVGSKILVEPASSSLPPELVTPVLYSTAPGQRSWEHRDPAKGISIYGQALLDGLTGQPEIQLKCTGDRCRIELSPLQEFVGARVPQLLAAARSQERQHVRLGGVSGPFLNITNIDRPPPAPTGPLTPLEAAVAGDHDVVIPAAEFEAFRSSLDTTRNTRITGLHFRHDGMVKIDWHTDALAELPPPPPMFEALAAETPIREVSATGRFSPRWLKDRDEGHRMFGSETVTALWQERTKVWLLGEKKWRGPEVIRLAEVARDGDRGRYRVRLQIAERDNVGHWLQLTDEQGGVHGCMLPRDVGKDSEKQKSPVFDLSYDRSEMSSGSARTITRLDVDLGDQGGALGLVAKLWRRYTTEHVAAAVQESEARELRDVIENKIESPLAATIAALVLLRANRLDRLPQDWLWNLADWFKELPDGPVLYAERRLREKQGTKKAAALALKEAATALLLVPERGIPRTSEAFDYAVSLVGRLKDHEELALGARQGLHELDRLLNNAFSTYRTGGLFSSFSGLPPDLDPDRLWRNGAKSAIEETAAAL